MSKTIKVRDLLNMDEDKMPEKIKLYGYMELVKNINYLSIDDLYITENAKNEHKWLDIAHIKLTDEVEIIEEQPEIDIQSYKELLLDQLRERKHTNADIYMIGTQINALIRAVKQLDNQINNK